MSQHEVTSTDGSSYVFGTASTAYPKRLDGSSEMWRVEIRPKSWQHTEMKWFVTETASTFLLLRICKVGLSESKHVRTTMLPLYNMYTHTYIYIDTHIYIYIYSIFTDLFSNLSSSTLAGHLLVYQLKWSWYHLWNVRDPRDIFPDQNATGCVLQVDGLRSCFLVAWSLRLDKRVWVLNGFEVLSIFLGSKEAAGWMGNNCSETFADLELHITLNGGYHCSDFGSTKGHQKKHQQKWIANQKSWDTTKLNGGGGRGW